MPAAEAVIVVDDAEGTALEEFSKQQRRKTHRQPGRETFDFKARRAMRLHLTETELELSEHRVNESGHLLLTLCIDELKSMHGSDKNLPQSWWKKTLPEFKFGSGIEALLSDRGLEDAIISKDCLDAIAQCWCTNPAQRKVQKLRNLLKNGYVLSRAECRYCLYKSVEQIGLSRSISDQMLWEMTGYWARIAHT